MPYTPTKKSAGHLECPGENVGIIKSVTDQSKGTQYDILLDIVFLFEEVGWERKMRIFGKFEKDAKGYVESGDRDMEKAYKILTCLGVSNPYDEEQKGIFLSEKGKWVHEDDTPIKDVAQLMEVLTADKLYKVLLEKDNKGYDRIVAILSADLEVSNNNSAEQARNYYNFLKGKVLSPSKPSSPQQMDDQTEFVFVP